MPVNKEKKKGIIEKVAGALQSAKSAVFVNFHGLNVGNTTELRRGLREKGVGYLVAKKTLVKRALDMKKTEGEMPTLGGELAIAYGDDLLAPAREVFAFQKKHKDHLAILGGIFEGRYMDKEEMEGIALIPSQKVLYAQFVNLINSPIQRFVVALNAIAEKKGQ